MVLIVTFGKGLVGVNVVLIVTFGKGLVAVNVVLIVKFGKGLVGVNVFFPLSSTRLLPDLTNTVEVL